MSTVVKDLGAVSAYAYAVEKGYTGTEAEFAELMADYADVGQTAVDAKDAAVAANTAAQTAAETATTKASEATTAAETATTKAGEASQSASQAQTSAQAASTKASEAGQSASTATEKATEATTAADSANTAKNDAETAKNAAETAQGKAETAQGAAEEAAENVSASAAQIATNTSDISELKSELTALKSDESDTHIDINTTLGRVMFSQGNSIFDNTSRTFANSYAELEPNKTYKVHIASGYKLYAALLNSAETTALYDNVPFGAAWITGEQTISFTTTPTWHYFRCSLMRADSGLMINDDLESIADLVKIETTIFATKTALAGLREDVNNSNLCLLPSGGQILYNADTKASGDYIVNALAYDDGVIIACRSNGSVVRIGYDGTEETLLSFSGSGFDWRLCWKDSNDNVYVSPHASWGSMTATDRGLYKLTKGASAFTKVISLYDTSSTVPTEQENNNDTIWTMCEDADGNLYAGVYAHTIHANPAIYKSTDGGDTWTYLYNFNASGLTTGGLHIHAIAYSPWKNALYCIVGEINTIFKSVDGGTTWTNLNITLRTKGSSMLATPNGLLVGSDGAYNCEIDWIHSDDTTHETVFSGWANTVFAIRRSDLTGFVYAFTKIDSSVAVEKYMPPYGVLHGTKSLEAWKAGDYTGGNAPAHLAEWEAYNASVKDKYPDDALRPQHFAILVSRNGGSIWEVLKAIPCESKAAYGIWTIGQFKNGECLCGVYTGNYVNGSFVTGVANPMVISEGKHKYVATGCDLDGEIFIRTNASPVVEVI